VDLSEGHGSGGYGGSLLNDCKYGHDIQDKAPDGGVIRLTLLRSPTSPDPEADQGLHHFTYSLLPHAGRWGRETIAQAYGLNDPLLVYEAAGTAVSAQPKSLPGLVSVDEEHVVIETIKEAEDGQGVIVRLYEAMQQRGPVTVRTAFPLAAVYRTNLLEDDEETLAHEENGVTFMIMPFEIVTLRLVPKQRN
jgi:alpha-mannosidase